MEEVQDIPSLHARHLMKPLIRISCFSPPIFLENRSRRSRSKVSQGTLHEEKMYVLYFFHWIINIWCSSLSKSLYNGCWNSFSDHILSRVSYYLDYYCIKCGQISLGKVWSLFCRFLGWRERRGIKRNLRSTFNT